MKLLNKIKNITKLKMKFAINHGRKKGGSYDDLHSLFKFNISPNTNILVCTKSVLKQRCFCIIKKKKFKKIKCNIIQNANARCKTQNRPRDNLGILDNS